MWYSSIMGSWNSSRVRISDQPSANIMLIREPILEKLVWQYYISPAFSLLIE